MEFELSLWDKIAIGTRMFLFGFESATDYALKRINAYLCTENIAANVQKACAYVNAILGYMVKYRRFCPVGWVTHYEKLIVAIQTLSDAFADSQITKEEIGKATADIQAAIEEWMKD